MGEEECKKGTVVRELDGQIKEATMRVAGANENVTERLSSVSKSYFGCFVLPLHALRTNKLRFLKFLLLFSANL